MRVHNRNKRHTCSQCVNDVIDPIDCYQTEISRNFPFDEQVESVDASANEHSVNKAKTTRYPIHGRDTITGYDFIVDKPLPRPQSIREYCRQCRPGQHPGSCQNTECSLHSYRTQSPEPSDLSRVKAVYAECRGCQNGSAKRVRECHISDCYLYPYRDATATRITNQKKA